jgi:hypothetical protein
MNSPISRIILITVALFVFAKAYSQYNRNQELISVILDVGGIGTPKSCNDWDTSAYYFAKVSILNTQDTTIHFWIISCSWPMTILTTNIDSVFFSPCFNGCDRDDLDEITLLPKKAVQFYCTIPYNNKSTTISTIKAGFRYFTNPEDLWDFDKTRDKKKVFKTFWSDEVELKDKMYSYEVR